MALRPVALALQGGEGAGGRRRSPARSRSSSRPTARRCRPSACSARQVPCDNFQDAEAFLRSDGERGRQLAFLTAGTYRINPALFEVVTPATRRNSYDMDAATICTSTRCRPIASASSRCSTAGRFRRAISRARSVEGHDSFQRGQAFVDAGGCRGLQEEVLLSGSWNLNPWFVQVEQVPLDRDSDRLRRRRRQLCRPRAPRRLGRRVHARRPRRARP